LGKDSSSRGNSQVLYRLGRLLGITARQTVEILVLPYWLVKDMASLFDRREVTGPARRPRSGEDGERSARRRDSPDRARDRVRESVLDRARDRARDRAERRRSAPARRRRAPPTARKGGALADALGAADPASRRLALESIGELEVLEVEHLLVDALHDPDPGVRCAAAEAAARAHLSSAVFSLILSLDDPELEVREAAQLAIERITEQSVEFDPRGGPAARRAAVEALKDWWKGIRFSQLAAEFGEAGAGVDNQVGGAGT
jgi:hypothetical protein